jgi:glycosyltransferase involved in cell wall biosynthesis
MNPKKILIITALFYPEPTVSANISYALAKKLSIDFEVTVICPPPTRPDGFSFPKTFPLEKFQLIRFSTYTCSRSQFFGRFWESYSFGKACKSFIHTNHDYSVAYINTWPIFAQYFTIKTLKKYKIKSFLHIQDVYPESFVTKLKFGKFLFQKLLFPFESFIMKNATHLFVISERMKKYLKETRCLSEDKISIVFNWYTAEEKEVHSATNPLKDDISRLTIMYLGNIGSITGLENIIDMFCTNDLSNIRLVIAGSGSQKEYLKKQVITQKCRNIEFIDVPFGMVQYIQNQADVLLLPLKKGNGQFSVPSKLPAYMFSKKPIIAYVDSDCDIAKIVKEANCGWVVDADDILSLLVKIKHISLMNKEYLNTQGQNGYEYVVNNFSEHINILKIINKVIHDN